MTIFKVTVGDTDYEGDYEGHRRVGTLYVDLRDDLADEVDMDRVNSAFLTIKREVGSLFSDHAERTVDEDTALTIVNMLGCKIEDWFVKTTAKSSDGTPLYEVGDGWYEDAVVLQLELVKSLYPTFNYRLVECPIPELNGLTGYGYGFFT